MDKSIIGLETEYGLFDYDFKPVQTSEQAQNAHVANHFNNICNNILKNLSGVELYVNTAYSKRIFLNNGGQAYNDGTHVEMSLPECQTAREVVEYDNAACLLFHDAIKKVKRKLIIIKNNLDAKGNSFGCHENYFVPYNTTIKRPKKDDDENARQFILWQTLPFLISRQIFAGSGSYDAKEDKFYLSQRSRVMKSVWGSSTLHDRSIFNSRDENFSETGLRIHLILGDATMSDWSTYLKVGTTNIVLRMAADGFLPIMDMANPLSALNEINSDINAKIKLRRFGWLGKFFKPKTRNALDIQRVYLEHAHKYFTSRCKPSPDDIKVVSEWEFVLNMLKADPISLDQYLDCWIKKSLMIGESAETKSSINFQYHIAVDGLYDKLVKKGKIKKLITLDSTLNAITCAPNTRALGRSKLIRQLCASDTQITNADWDVVETLDEIFNLPEPYETYNELETRI